jgi:glycosyltransferase involved in cell wall biosynthesis
MRILFLYPRDTAYNSKTVREQPSGGTEKAVIFLGEALKKLGHEVYWATNPQAVAAWRGAGSEVDIRPDVVIAQEAEYFEDFPLSRKVWWVHHFSDQPVIMRGAAFARAFADKIVTLSRCQQHDFSSKLRLNTVAIGHGVWLDELCNAPSAPSKDPYRLIYASAPFRGLERVPALFRQIRQHEPRATIAICSSMATYGDTEAHRDAEFKAVFDELATIEGVDLLGSLNQQALYREYARASIFFYPCTWPETYCLALDEAIAHGCVPVVSDIGALGERIGTGLIFSNIDANFPFAVINWVSGYFPYPRHGDYPRDWMDVARQWEREVLHGG